MFNPFKRKAPMSQTATAAQPVPATQSNESMILALNKTLVETTLRCADAEHRLQAVEQHLESATSFKCGRSHVRSELDRIDRENEATATKIDRTVHEFAELCKKKLGATLSDDPILPPDAAANVANTQPRELTSHRVNECNEAIKVLALDPAGPGGASHIYAIEIPVADDKQGFRDKTDGVWKDACILRFQNGAIKEVGTNGVTHEAVLAVLEDRLVGFQSGPYANNLNAAALYHIQAAQRCLKMRTNARVSAGVEGTMQPDRKNWPGPRRNQLLSFTPAELVLFDAVSAVEAAGAHPLLTDAVLLLAQSRTKIADFVDLPPQK